MLTAADVEQKTFSTALRGYDLDEVDDFLDEVVTTLRALNEQLESAGTAEAETSVAVTPALTPELEPAPVVDPKPELEPAPVVDPKPELEPAPVVEPEPELEHVGEEARPEIDESAIGRALIAAQEAADRLLEGARTEAELIVEEAKTDADSWSAEREAKRREAEAEVARLTLRVAAIRSELSVLAGEVAERLDEMDSVINSASDDVTGPGGADEPEALGEPTAVAGEIRPSDSQEWPEVEGDVSDVFERGSDEPDQLDAMLSDVVNDLRLPGGGHTHEESHDSEPDGDGAEEPSEEGHVEDE